MRGAPPTSLFDALATLRDAPEPLDRAYESAWRVVSTHLRQGRARASADEDDAVQETLFKLARSVHAMRATTPEGAAAWLETVRRRKRLDGLRAAGREPARLGLTARRSDDEGGTDPLEALPGDAPLALPEDALERLLDDVEDRVAAWLEAHERSPSTRHIRRQQARATLHRTVLGASHAALVAVLDADEPLTEDRVYKWVERGRAVLSKVLDAWETELEEAPESAAIVGRLRELCEARRSDAGLARPERRRHDA